MKKALIIASLLFAFLLAPAAGVMAQETDSIELQNYSLEYDDVAENWEGEFNYSVDIDSASDADEARLFIDGVETETTSITSSDETVTFTTTVSGTEGDEVDFYADLYDSVGTTTTGTSTTTSGTLRIGAFQGLSSGITLSDIGGYVVDLFGQIWVIVALAIAIPLTFYVIKRLKGIFA